MALLLYIAALLLMDNAQGMETLCWASGLGVVLLLTWSRRRTLALPLPMLQLLIFPTLMLCVLLHGLYAHPLADFLKDGWYFTLPIVYLSLGYLAFERGGSWRRLLEPVVFTGLFVAVYGLVHAALNRSELTSAASVDDYRNVTGTGNFIPMMPLVVVLLMRRAEMPALRGMRSPLVRAALYSLCAAAVLVSFSRTHILTLVAVSLLGVRWREVPRRLLGNGGLPLVAVLLAATGAVFYLATAKSGPVGLFITKILHSGSEVQVRAYETVQQINNNWRGYEAYRATKTYEGYSTMDKIFGGGGGALVDLGFAMQLSTTQAFKYVPVTHNGYMYILVKTGVVGIGLFGCFVLQLFWLGRQALRLRDPEARFAGLALLWTPLVIFGTQGVITGIYNKGELLPVLFLAGAAAASYAQRRCAREDVVAERRWSAARGTVGQRPGIVTGQPIALGGAR